MLCRAVLCTVCAGLTPLMAAAKAGKQDVVATLLELGADAWLGDNSGESPTPGKCGIGVGMPVIVLWWGLSPAWGKIAVSGLLVYVLGHLS